MTDNHHPALSFSSEAHLEDWFCENVFRLDSQRLVGRQVSLASAGICDVLTLGPKPDAGYWLGPELPLYLNVWELKNVKARHDALEQVCRYMRVCRAYNPAGHVNGVLLAPAFTDEVVMIASEMPDVYLFTFGITGTRASLNLITKSRVEEEEMPALDDHVTKAIHSALGRQ